jgi:glutathione S-transferase
MLGYLDLRLPEMPWRRRHPALVALWERLDERPSFRSTVPVAQEIAGSVA